MPRKTLATLATIVLLIGCASPAPPLTDEVRAVINDEIKRRAWTQPESIEVRGSFLVIDWEVPDTLAVSKRRFAEDRLLAIRDAVIGYGYKDYRVNVNGPAPGVGLVKRYGSARFIDGGSVEWLTP